MRDNNQKYELPSNIEINEGISHTTIQINPKFDVLDFALTLVFPAVILIFSILFLIIYQTPDSDAPYKEELITMGKLDFIVFILRFLVVILSLISGYIIVYLLTKRVIINISSAQFEIERRVLNIVTKKIRTNCEDIWTFTISENRTNKYSDENPYQKVKVYFKKHKPVSIYNFIQRNNENASELIRILETQQQKFNKKAHQPLEETLKKSFNKLQEKMGKNMEFSHSLQGIHWTIKHKNFKKGAEHLGAFFFVLFVSAGLFMFFGSFFLGEPSEEHEYNFIMILVVRFIAVMIVLLTFSAIYQSITYLFGKTIFITTPESIEMTVKTFGFTTYHKTIEWSNVESIESKKNDQDFELIMKLKNVQKTTLGKLLNAKFWDHLQEIDLFNWIYRLRFVTRINLGKWAKILDVNTIQEVLQQQFITHKKD